MAKFSYVAVDKNGREKSGTVDAESQDKAREKLRSDGLFPTTITQKGAAKKAAADFVDPSKQRTPAWMAGKVKQKELTLFTRQFATLLESGLPMVRALDIMTQMLKPGAMRNSVLDLTDEVQAGSGVSDSMAKQPKVFDNLYCSMIKAGEASGQLGKILGRLAEFREKAEKLKKQIIGALIYPIAVLSIATLIVAGIITFIVPKFKEMFAQMKVDLPGMTQLLLDIADTMVEIKWGFIPAVLLYVVVYPLIFYAIFKVVRMSEQGRYYTDLAILHIPLFGMIVKKSTISRFCRTMGELDSAGVPVLDSLGIIKDAVNNAVIRAAVNDIHTGIREGENMSAPMRRSGQFDLMTLNMVEVGEETGELDKMLIRVANNYDADVDALIAGMMSLMEPMLIVGMGGAVGFIVIALFMPLLSIITNLNGG